MSQDKIFVGVLKEKSFSWGSFTSMWLRKEDLELINNHLNDAGGVNLDIKMSRAGKPYAEINTYKPNGSGSSTGNTQAPIVTPSEQDVDPPF